MSIGLGLLAAAIMVSVVVVGINVFNLGKKKTWLDKLPPFAAFLCALLVCGLYIFGVGVAAFELAAYLK